MPAVPTITSTQFFQALYVTPEPVVLVLVNSACGTCASAKALDALAEKFDKIKFYKIDAQTDRELTDQLGVKIKIPTFIAYRGLDPMRTPQRALSVPGDKQLLAWLGKLVPEP